MSFVNQRVLLKTPFNPITGYGRDGFLLAEGLPKLGCELHLEPKYVGLPVPESVLPLFSRERPLHFEVAINHEYPGEIGFPLTMHLYADKTVGWTMFEFTGFGPDHEMTEQLYERLSNFDLMLAYDEVSHQALLPYMDDPARLQILQGGYDSDTWKIGEDDAARDWDGTFKFCMNGTMNLRKNPWAVLFAFKALKDEHGDAFDAELHMKTTSMALPPQLEDWCPGLKIHYMNWSTAELKAFYSQMNCLLAPSWGEGKNLPALEAQTTGCPVIVSAFGGHMQWADSEWAYLVDGPIEEHSPEMGSMRVTPETVAEKMWYVYNNRYEAKRKGELASRMIPQMCDWEPVLQNLQLRVDAVTRRNRG